MKIMKKLRLKVIERNLKELYKRNSKVSGFSIESHLIYKEIDYWETYRRALVWNKELEWVIDEYDGLPYLEIKEE